ncbi:hypothetical protein SLEP1_g27100 [Rubroshorea leprosula]|uniref:Expansin-like EG45 domain-containing protein n=1 Tax=Rubroshorea leprosula TaxID=152421 RepID=A0AAV5JWE9_9ROSI|nr:hypothetical protein SLEP1_g27100 [Rubroshorea leprosula]
MRKLNEWMIISFFITLFGVLPLVLSDAGVDPPTGTASYYTPTRFSRTACEEKNGSAKLPDSIYPVAVSDRLWDSGAGCGRRFNVRCISEGSPHFCKTGVVINVSIQDRAKTMQSKASDYDADMIIIQSGYAKIAFPNAKSVPIQYEKV